MQKLSHPIKQTRIQTRLVLYFSILNLLTVAGIVGYAYIQVVSLGIESNNASTQQLAKDMAVRIAIEGIIVAFLLIIVSYLLARKITKPLRALLNVTANIAAGDLNATVPLLSTDEIGILAQTINEMTQTIRETLAGLDFKLREQKQFEKERETFIIELEAKNSELTQFTYTVSHDLKSPLVTINGYLGYIEEDAAAGNMERLKQDTQRIRDATNKMYALLTELLELSRIGRMMNEPKNITFADLVNNALDIVHGQLETYHVTVRILTPHPTQPNLPLVYVDRQRLIEVLQNLLDNAAKYMGAQSNPLIEIGQDGEEDSKPIFFVKDNGMGIAPEYHERIFGLFNKLDAKSEGTGVGLTLVKRIIEVHGGRIWVESEIGKGSIFYFTLPLGQNQMTPATDPITKR